ncbi:ABC transporter ATP-binding protein [Cerasicoccus arenae]|uniref:ABC transporter ATP-binding protein n=1 Tax=Cerasicoccus arenae TaxID=424488 RepID=A0A8J3GBM5_9BACT|nr:ABC transporter ATP-binding protein [Cerasicoccus arenae]MBK1857055.1 ABC transporter ATP-binding protein [Cerasicoccus arenae]GHB92101.1 ABC transporter ATP-binding protein [Cerasicoccus arenae]
MGSHLPNDSDVLIDVHQVGKKFCRSLKRSLMYGAKDIVRAMNPLLKTGISDSRNKIPELRKDEFWAIQNISFQLRRGECVGLIGHNGAGKSTLLKVLNGLIKPDTGHIRMRGRVCALIELGAGFNPILTGRENIYNSGALLGIRKKEIDEKLDEIVAFSELDQFIDMPVQNYSSGMKVRLGFAVAIQMEPDILLLDEVLAVGDIAFRHKCVNAMAGILSKSAVIFVSHSMPQVARVCSQILLMDHGKSTYNGGNVGLGIEKYYSMCGGGEAMISGTRDIQFNLIKAGTSIESASSTSSELQISHAQGLYIELRVKATEQVQSARFQITIWNMDMLPVVNIINADYQGRVVNFKETGKQEVVLKIECPPLHLNCGRYFLSAVATSVDQSMVYCRHDNIVSLQVEGISTTAAAILQPANWN